MPRTRVGVVHEEGFNDVDMPVLACDVERRASARVSDVDLASTAEGSDLQNTEHSSLPSEKMFHRRDRWAVQSRMQCDI